MSGNPENRTQVPPGPGLESQDKNFVSGGSVPNGPTSKDLENPHPSTNLLQTGDYATTGPDKPLKKYTDSEKKQLEVAEKASSLAYQAWKDGERQGLPKEKLDDLKAKAMEKDEILKGMQDLCD